MENATKVWDSKYAPKAYFASTMIMRETGDLLLGKIKNPKIGEIEYVPALLVARSILKICPNDQNAV